MAKKKDSIKEPRTPLSKERVFLTAVQIADEGGLTAVTMRKIAKKLGVEAMSLYHHAANKDEILDGMVNVIFSEIDFASSETSWKTKMRKHAVSAREMLMRHTWALSLIDSWTRPGSTMLKHGELVIESLREAGFSIAIATHILFTLDSYIYGFVLQGQNLPFDSPEELAELATTLQRIPDDEYPYTTEMIVDWAQDPGFSFANEFEFGLDLILDGFERIRDTV